MDITLSNACDHFVARLSSADIPGKVSSEADLNEFDRAFPGLMPHWYREVLATKPLADICFKAEVEGLPWGGEGHIRDAATLLPEIQGAHPDIDLTKVGYLVIGAAWSGDGWVIRSDSSPEDPVWHFSMSPWGSGDPRDTKGCLLIHGATFAEFLSKIDPIQ